ncbi:uroporphyrinogen decarboxylase family protein [Thermodesulfobacteriota bacterium]
MSELTSRERVAIVLDHKEADRVPLDIGAGRQTSIYPGPYLSASKLLGLGEPKIVTSSRGVIDDFDERFLEAFGIDFRRVSLRDVPEDLISEPKGIVRDQWGIGWKKFDPFWSPVEQPLKDATLDDLMRYPWPDPEDERRFKGLREEAEYKCKNTPYAIVAKQPSHVYGILTQSIYLRGMDTFFMDLIMNKEFALELLEKVGDYHTRLYERYIEEVGEFVQIVHTAADLGTQSGPYFSLDMYREMIKPFDQTFFKAIKSKTEAKILFHSDGAITSLIDDLVEIGVDILNPVQPSEEMDPPTLKALFGDRMSFHGGIDQHRVLPQGSTDDVREEVIKRIKQLAAGGGYILAAAQTIMPEVPGENVVQMFRSARECGNYPIGSEDNAD